MSTCTNPGPEPAHRGPEGARPRAVRPRATRSASVAGRHPVARLARSARRVRAVLAALVAMAPAACGAGDTADSTGAGTSSALPGVPVRSEMRIVVVSHGQASDPFWSVVANGIDDAADDLGVAVDYQAPIRFDMVRMSNLIDAAVASRPDALVVSVPDPDALGASIRAAIDAGIPTISLNSGAGAWRDLGLLAHIGQTDYEAGLAAGGRLAGAGVTHALCVNHEVGNLSLDRRCRGLGDALEESGGTMQVLAVDLADPESARQRVAGALAAEPGIDGVLTLGPTGAVPTLAALEETGALDRLAFGTFDLAPEVLTAIRDGRMLFAIDQQPYLQGYLAVVTMTKYLEARTLPGGGQIVRTGPSFVTQDDAATLIALTEQGIR